MPIPDQYLDQIFTNAHTHHGWQNRPVSNETLRKLYDFIKWAPTCVNGSPMRLVFIQSTEAKKKLIPCLMEKNIEKTNTAPVTVVIAQDISWHEKLDILSPHLDYKPMFKSNSTLSAITAFRNSSLQGAYLIIAARALGLDVGPMSGFNPSMVDDLFFKETTWQTNFLCNIGYGDQSKIYPRAPRLSYEEVCKTL